MDRSAPSVGVRRLFLGLAVAFFALGGVYIAAGVVRLANPHYAGWFSLGNAYWYELAPVRFRRRPRSGEVGQVAPGSDTVPPCRIDSLWPSS